VGETMDRERERRLVDEFLRQVTVGDGRGAARRGSGPH
jgi:hypothetical protein